MPLQEKPSLYDCLDGVYIILRLWWMTLSIGL